MSTIATWSLNIWKHCLWGILLLQFPEVSPIMSIRIQMKDNKSFFLFSSDTRSRKNALAPPAIEIKRNAQLNALFFQQMNRHQQQQDNSKQSAQIIRRRQTLMECTRIPIGAKGRRRQSTHAASSVDNSRAREVLPNLIPIDKRQSNVRIASTSTAQFIEERLRFYDLIARREPQNASTTSMTNHA